MSADKRTVSTDALETLGTIITLDEKRDAIHLAVEPVIAAVQLQPGQHVGLLNGKAHPTGVKFLGIVDPFLREPVEEGQAFWLVVYPRQIKSLRHVWEHPDFPASGETEHLPEAKAASEWWLRTFCKQQHLPDYEDMVRAVLEHPNWDGEYLHFDGQDAHGTIPPLFWEHMEVVTGRRFAKEERAVYFSCSC